MSDEGWQIQRGGSPGRRCGGAYVVGAATVTSGHRDGQRDGRKWTPSTSSAPEDRRAPPGHGKITRERCPSWDSTSRAARDSEGDVQAEHHCGTNESSPGPAVWVSLSMTWRVELTRFVGHLILGVVPGEGGPDGTGQDWSWRILGPPRRRRSLCREGHGPRSLTVERLEALIMDRSPRDRCPSSAPTSRAA